jgi:phosphoribosylamine--glycine ligase
VKILVIGSGGREHALVWKLKQSPRVKKIFCAPGNAGISELAELADISAENIPGLLDFAREKTIDLVVVGPEAPLVGGIVDEFQKAGLTVWGPGQQAAQLEGSKYFAKDLMKKYLIPQADFGVFENFQKARDFLKGKKYPLVVKADGLAAGKGVIIARDEGEAVEALSEIMEKKIFGPAGNLVVIEEFLQGEEASLLAFSDGRNILPMVSAQDHKQVFDNDEGPNTGGMGAYSPVPVVTPKIYQEVSEKILKPTIAGLNKEGIKYVGVLYAGLMITKDGPKVLEFNVRFGDPETQVILPRLKNDLVTVIEASLAGRLEKIKLEWDNRACVCVVLAAGGYPGSYVKGDEISGFEEVKRMKDVIVFHAGTKLKDGKIVTNGGRILGVTALGEGIKETVKKTYQAVGKIKFNNMHFRTDIGQKALEKSAV